MRARVYLSMSAAAALAVTLHAPAQAQTSAPAPAGSGQAGSGQAGESNGTAVDDVVVTARRRAENVQDTPISITALTGQDLVRTGTNTVQDLNSIAPNLFSSGSAAGAGTVFFSIRGQTQLDTQVSLDPSVALYLDDVYIATSNGVLNDLADIDHVEVLKGPQGTLFGRNTTGGAISVYTNKPTYELSGSLRARYGSFDEFGFEGVLNVPLIDQKAAIRLVGLTDQDSGYARNVLSGEALGRRFSRQARASLLLQPDDRLTITIRGDYSFLRNRGRVTKLTYVQPASVNPQNPFLIETAAELGLFDPTTGAPNLAAAEAALQPYFLGSNPRRAYTNARSPSNGLQANFGRFEQWGVSARAELDLGAVTVRSITAYRKLSGRSFADADGTPFSILQYETTLFPRQFSQELQLIGTAFDNRLNWVTGLYYYQVKGADGSNASNLNELEGLVPSISNPFISVGDNNNTSRAVFAQGTFKITDRLAFTAGGRYTSERKQLDLVSTAGGQCALPPELVPASGACATRLSKKFNGWSYIFDLEYKPNQDVLLYAKTSRGFRSGGQNFRARGTADGFQPFRPETVTDYELGIKSEWLNRALRFNAALFYSQYSDIQRVTLLPGQGGIAQAITNAAKARIYGAEVETVAVPTQGLRLGANFGWTNARYRNFVDLTGDRSNEPFVLTPEFSYTLLADYQFNIGQSGSVRLHADWRWTDSVEFGRGSPGSREPSYGLLNGRISYFPNEDIELAVFGRNLLDKQYNEGRFDFVQDLGFSVAYVGDPRVVGVEARFKF